MSKTIAFHSNQLSVRGTEVALYDYADYFERLYQGRSIIVTPKISDFHDVRSAERFSKRFQIYPYESAGQLDDSLRKMGVDILYCIKAGFNDGILSKVCKNVVHAVFPYYEPHGDVYAYVSNWISQEIKVKHNLQIAMPFVPHIVSLPTGLNSNLRDELGIPQSAIVFGRHGGPESFNIGFVKEVLPLIVERNSQIYFLFANTHKFCQEHPQIIHLDAFSNIVRKVSFIHSCDAMLHASEPGETFGLATAEFAFYNRPVFTWGGCKEKAHLEYLGERAIIYNDVNDLALKLLSFIPKENRGNCPYIDFTPRNVMEKFVKVFVE